MTVYLGDFHTLLGHPTVTQSVGEHKTLRPRKLFPTSSGITLIFSVYLRTTSSGFFPCREIKQKRDEAAIKDELNPTLTCAYYVARINMRKDRLDLIVDIICLSSKHERIAAWFWWMTDFMGHSGHIFPIKECQCEYCVHVWDVEQEVTFKLAYNNKPTPPSLIIPVWNQASMAENTPTAYTPNTLTGNLLSPRAFVCSFEWQPANRGRERSGKRKIAGKNG